MDFEEAWKAGTLVRLRPEPGGNAFFDGWGGDCEGLGDRTVVVVVGVVQSFIARFGLLDPTAAVVTAFEAVVWPDGRAEVTWETASEAHIAGFHV